MSIGLLRVLALGVLLCPVLFAIAEGAEPETSTAAAVKPPPKASVMAADTKAYSRAAERTVLLQQRKEAQQMVRELTERLTGVSDPSVRGSLQRQIIETKREARLRFLRTKASFARGRGEYQVASRIDQAIETTLRPRFSAPVVAPDKKKGAVRKDGQP